MVFVSETKQLKRDLFAYFLENIPSGEGFVMKGQSSSADVIWSLAPKRIVEIECKNKYGNAITAALVQKEINTSIVGVAPAAGFKSVFIIVQSSGADKTLILKSGEYDANFKKTSVSAMAKLIVPKGMLLLIPGKEKVVKFLGTAALGHLLPRN